MLILLYFLLTAITTHTKEVPNSITDKVNKEIYSNRSRRFRSTDAPPSFQLSKTNRKNWSLTSQNNLIRDYSYDKEGRIVNKLMYHRNGLVSSFTTYIYDESDRLLNEYSTSEEIVYDYSNEPNVVAMHTLLNEGVDFYYPNKKKSNNMRTEYLVSDSLIVSNLYRLDESTYTCETKLNEFGDRIECIELSGNDTLSIETIEYDSDRRFIKNSYMKPINSTVKVLSGTTNELFYDQRGLINRRNRSSFNEDESNGWETSIYEYKVEIELMKDNYQVSIEEYLSEDYLYKSVNIEFNSSYDIIKKVTTFLNDKKVYTLEYDIVYLD